MHTDRKIGFAMGILLIGIVAALFFRNEPLVDSSVPSVRRERELNERLRERDVAVYLNDDSKETDVEEDDQDPQWSVSLRDVLKGMGERNRTMPTPIGSSRLAPPVDSDMPESDPGDRRPAEVELFEAYLSQKNGAGRQSSVRPSEQRRPNPLPLLPIPEVDSLSHPRTASTKQPASTGPAAEPGSDEGATTADRDRQFDIPAEFDEYVVRYGDTLSGIAQKMLGSQARYREIYEANRDRMSSPDKLDVGKPLRIPRVAASERTAQ